MKLSEQAKKENRRECCRKSRIKCYPGVKARRIARKLASPITPLSSRELTLFFAWSLLRLSAKGQVKAAWERSHPRPDLKGYKAEWHKKDVAKKKAVDSVGYLKDQADRAAVWRGNNRERHLENQRAWEKRAYRENFDHKLAKTVRCRINDALHKGWKGGKTTELLGCSISHLKSWLEFWMKPGMTWENHGEWHIDHKKPCASFDLTKLEEQKKCFHYTNLEPLWAHDNLSKGAK